MHAWEMKTESDGVGVTSDGRLQHRRRQRPQRAPPAPALPPLLSTSLPRSSERQTRHGFDDESGQEVKTMSWLDEGPPM